MSLVLVRHSPSPTKTTFPPPSSSTPPKGTSRSPYPSHPGPTSSLQPRVLIGTWVARVTQLRLAACWPPRQPRRAHEPGADGHGTRNAWPPCPRSVLIPCHVCRTTVAAANNDGRAEGRRVGPVCWHQRAARQPSAVCALHKLWLAAAVPDKSPALPPTRVPFPPFLRRLLLRLDTGSSMPRRSMPTADAIFKLRQCRSLRPCHSSRRRACPPKRVSANLRARRCQPWPLTPTRVASSAFPPLPRSLGPSPPRPLAPSPVNSVWQGHD